MKNEHISDALNMLDDKMLTHTEKLRSTDTVKLKHRLIPRLIAAAAVIAVSGITVFAAVNGGYFKDIKNIFGAVTGTEYVQAESDIDISVCSTNAGIKAEISLLKTNEAPYRYIEQLSIGSCRIINENGETVAEYNDITEKAEIVDAKAVISLPVTDLADGTYILEVTTLIGSSKADADLVISGRKTVEFII